MFFESILKRKQEMKRSINNTQKQYPIYSMKNDPNIQFAPQPRNHHLEPTCALKKTHSMSHLHIGKQMSSSITHQNQISKLSDSKMIRSHYERAENDNKMEGSKDQFSCMKYSTGSNLMKANSFQGKGGSKSRKGSSFCNPTDSLLDHNHRLMQKCEEKDQNIQFLKRQSRAMMKTQVETFPHHESHYQKENLTKGNNSELSETRKTGKCSGLHQKSDHWNLYQSTVTSPLTLQSGEFQDFFNQKNSSCPTGSQEVKELKSKNEALLLIVEKIEKEKEKLEMSTRQLQKEVAKSNSEQGSLKGKILEFQIHNDKLKFENRNLLVKIEDLSKKIDQKNCNDQFRDLQDMKNLVRKLENQRRNIASQLNQEKKEQQLCRDIWNNEKKNLLVQIQSLKKDKHQITEEKRLLSQKINDTHYQNLENSLQHNNQKFENLEKEHNWLNSMVNELRQALGSHKIQSAEKLKTIEKEYQSKEQKLMNSLKEKQEELTAVSEKHSIKVRQIGFVKEELKLQSEKSNKYLERIKQLEVEIKLRDQNQMSLKEQKVEREEKSKELELEIGKLRTEIERSKESMVAKDILIREKRERAKNLEEKMQELVKSEEKRAEENQKMKKSLTVADGILIKYEALEKAYTEKLIELEQKEKQFSQGQQSLEIKNKEMESLKNIIQEQNQMNEAFGRESENDKQRLSFQITSLQQELEFIKKEVELKEHYQGEPSNYNCNESLLSLQNELFSLLRIESRDGREILNAVTNLMNEIMDLKQNNLTDLYFEVLELFDVSHSVGTFHENLMGEISNFHSNQTLMVQKLRVLEEKNESLQKSNSFLRKASEGDHEILRNLERTIEQQNEEILKFKMRRANNKYEGSW